MTQSLDGHERSMIRENGQETRPAATSTLFDQLSAGVAESVRLQTQLNERFAVRLLEFGNSLYGATDLPANRRPDRDPHGRAC